MRKTIIPTVVIVSCLFVFNAPMAGAESELKDDLAKLQGKWKATVTTDQGSSKWTLEIKGNKSTVQIESSEGDTVFKAENEFKLEKHGKFKAYTYFNVKILSGDRAGQMELTEGQTRSAIYQLDEDTWTTISGFREDEEQKPRLIKWEKAAK
jgi:uncharacterized protein (TIGR03067 family)